VGGKAGRDDEFRGRGEEDGPAEMVEERFVAVVAVLGEVFGAGRDTAQGAGGGAGDIGDVVEGGDPLAGGE
jgi:hypothetical protein